MQNASIPKPTPDESYVQYAIRAHRATLDTIPDADDRTAAVQAAWTKYRGKTDAEATSERVFGPKKWKPNPGVCVFAEHDTVGPDGAPRHYGLRELVGILNDANERISELKAFPAISEGHTPEETGQDGAHPGASDPPTLGYVGSYNLGMIGKEKPTWAIFANEYHDPRPESLEKLSRKRRRSVEIWKFKDGRSFFDPIAALGGEAPRLPLPVKLSARTDKPSGAEVMKYSMGPAAPAPAPAYPGGVNTSPKSWGDKKRKRDKYECGTKKYQQEPGAMLNNEDLKQIMAALMETPQMKYLTESMQKEAAAENQLEQPEAATAPPAPPMAEAPEKMQAEEAAAPPMPSPAAADAEGMEGLDDDTVDLATLLSPETPAAPPEDAESEEYMGMGHKYEGDGMPAAEMPMDYEDEELAKMSQRTQGAQPDRYSQLVAKHNQLVQSHQKLLADAAADKQKYAALNGQVEELLRDREDARRKAKIAELHHATPHMVDVAEEEKACLYSLGSTMDAAAFDAHVVTVEKYAARSLPQTQMIPQGEMPYELDRGKIGGPIAERDSYEQRCSARAVELATEAASRGEFLNYDEGMAKARAELANQPQQ